MSDLVPEGWKFSSIGECCKILDSKRVPLNSEERAKRLGNYPYYGANGIQGYVDSFIFDCDAILVAEDGGNFDQYAERPIAQWVTGKYWVNNHAHIIRANENNLHKWIYYCLVHKNILKFINGGTRSKLNQSDLREIQIPIPTLSEQKKITSILTSVDEVIDNTQKQIDKLQDLKKATMNELLTKGISHTEFKDSKFGKIPKNWECYELGQLCTFTQGIQISLDETLRKNREGYIRYLYINDFSSERNLRFIKDEFPTKIVKDKELVMANTGHSAGTIFRGKHGVLSNNAFKISIKKNIESEYLFYFLSTDTYWFNIRKLFNTAGQPHVGHTNIAKLQFFCPPLDEQKKIISIIQKIDQNISDKNRKVSKIRSIKKSLMQDLLTGKVRVKVN